MINPVTASPLRYADLPNGLCRQAQLSQATQGLYGYLSRPLIDSLARFCDGKNVIEAYAGRGHLSSLLKEQGIAVKATSLQSSHDGSADLGYVHPVEQISVHDAAVKYADWMDVLLVCWPTSDSRLFWTLPWLPPATKIIFIGEITDYTRNPAFLGGCASDAFFDAVQSVPHDLSYPTFRQDQIAVFTLKS